MIRDSNSKALVETDVDKRNKYIMEKKKLREISTIKKDISDLRHTVSALSEKLEKILEEQ